MASQTPISGWGIDTLIEEPPLEPVNHCSEETDEKVRDVFIEEDDDDPTADHLVMHQALRSLRERRHQGSCDRVRVHKSISLKKGRIKKRSSTEKSSRRSQEHTAASCLRKAIITPSVASESDMASQSTFPTSTRNLLQQLKEIELHYSNNTAMTPPPDTTMTSPPNSPQSSHSSSSQSSNSSSPQPSDSSIRGVARMLARGVSEGCLRPEEPTSDAPEPDPWMVRGDNSLHSRGEELYLINEMQSQPQPLP